MRDTKTGDTQRINISDKTLPMTERQLEETSRFFPRAISERYKIRRPLGSGAFGAVYLAEDLKLGRLVAIKQLYSMTADDSKIKQRFFQEAKIAGQLEHPNIVIVYNIEGEDDSTFIVMEYLGGGSLHELLRKESRLEIRTAIQIMLGILTGLDAAHHIMVIHRDIKPHNILFGINSVPKLTDFGIALLPKHAGGIDDMSHANKTLFGTPMYMSPEQIMMETLDQRSDLYSAGVILYRMLTGRELFVLKKNWELHEAAELILRKKPERIETFRNDAPTQINDVVFKLLEKNPENRYPDAVSAMRDLIKVLSLMKSDPADDEKLLFAPTAGLINSPAAILEDIIYLLLIDGIITPAERTELQKRTERLGLSEIQSRAIEKNIRKKRGLPSLEALDEYTEAAMKIPAGQTLEQKRVQLGISEEEAALILRLQKKAQTHS